MKSSHLAALLAAASAGAASGAQTTTTVGLPIPRYPKTRCRSANTRGHIHAHRPAGSKAARMAAQHRLTVRP